MIAVVDFGSQFTQLIAKKLRHLGYACEVWSYKTLAKDLEAAKISGVIFSGSPASVGQITPDPELINLKCPKLGLCFGYQWSAHILGGRIEKAHREYGKAYVKIEADAKGDKLLQGFSDKDPVWMSHGDSVVELPRGAKRLLTSNEKNAGFVVAEKNLWALQFHPEVHHSIQGHVLLENFAKNICALKPDWKLGDQLSHLKSELQDKLKGVDHVTCAVSGGVDSTVMAVLLSTIVKVKALYVDHGFQRVYDLEDLKKTFARYPNIDLEILDVREEFWKHLKGVSDPEQKRQIIGRLFIESFNQRIEKEKNLYLAQGTIYSDVIESAANPLGPAHKIKSHHNVGGLPEGHGLHLIEPLRKFFKDEVREIGKLLGIGDEFIHRHPFPGPGLAVRCVGALLPERIEIIRQSDRILNEELRKRGLYQKTWQAFTVLLPISTVGVMGDERSYESVLAIRAVNSLDAMTAEATEFTMHDLKEISSRMINEIKGINRVVYDLTSKPPGTIEWE